MCRCWVVTFVVAESHDQNVTIVMVESHDKIVTFVVVESHDKNVTFVVHACLVFLDVARVRDLNTKSRYLDIFSAKKKCTCMFVVGLNIAGFCGMYRYTYVCVTTHVFTWLSMHMHTGCVNSFHAFTQTIVTQCRKTT